MEDPRNVSMTSNMSVEENESQEQDPSVWSSQGTAGFKKPGTPASKKQKGELALLREQLADSKEREEQQRKDMKEQLEKQRQDAEQQQKELMKILTEQQKQSKEQLAEQQRQMARQEEQYKEQIKLLKQVLDRR